ncbi:transcription initiation protein SPT3 homolog [Chironomus tepperi]|uniref:transcription initiation protein SPT3 homolog n=1 Tax=Chironomus tepperi TaxID=113505 RepID=UPI00391F2923
MNSQMFSRRENKINTNNNNNNNSNNEYKSKIYDEIAILMRSFGDISDSSLQIRESIILVEKILIQQLQEILENAMNNAHKRTGSFVPNQLDFELLMVKNKPKLARFRKYMRNIQKIQRKNEQKHAGSNYDMNFLNQIAEENKSDDEEINDTENMRRLYRADRISQILSVEKYEEFQKARCWSSNIKNKISFLNKLMEILQVPKEIQDDSNCLEIIQFLTHETVATLIDYSILTRLNSKTLSAMDQNIVQSNLSNNMLRFCPEVTQGRAFDGIKPVKVQEIQEAMRRFHLMRNQKKIGFPHETKAAFLAL